MNRVDFAIIALMFDFCGSLWANACLEKADPLALFLMIGSFFIALVFAYLFTVHINTRAEE